LGKAYTYLRMAEVPKERGRSGGKKNPLSNATMFALFKAAQEVLPTATIRSPINWNSLTKGKLSVWLPKGQKVDHKEGIDKRFQVRANLVIEAKSQPTIRRDSLPISCWDPDGTDLNVGNVIAVNVLKYALRFLRPGEEGEADPNLEEWVFELQIGQPAAEAIQRALEAVRANLDARAAGSTTSAQVKDFCSEVECASAASGPCAECKNLVCGRCKHSCRKGDGRTLNIKPGERSRVSLMVDDLFSIFGMTLSPLELREELEFRLTMFHNQSHTEGFVTASNQTLSPYLANLQNRL